MNPYRLDWVRRIHQDETVSPAAKALAEPLANAGVTGKVALTNWQSINRKLGRPTMDHAVLRQIQELQAAGYLGRYQGNVYNQSRGWRLFFPEEESNLLEFAKQCA